KPKRPAAASRTRIPTGITSRPIPSPGMTAIRWVLVMASPEPERLPPGEADGQPERGMRQGHDEADLPPLGLAQVARAVEHDGRPGAVVGHRGVDAGEE